MRYRILESEGNYKVQRSRFGIIWKTLRGSGMAWTDSIWRARLTITWDVEKRKKKPPDRIVEERRG